MEPFLHCAGSLRGLQARINLSRCEGVGENMRFDWQLICYNAAVGSKDFEKGEKP
jgi:hypothetical protein